MKKIFLTLSVALLTVCASTSFAGPLAGVDAIGEVSENLILNGELTNFCDIYMSSQPAAIECKDIRNYYGTGPLVVRACAKTNFGDDNKLDCLEAAARNYRSFAAVRACTVANLGILMNISQLTCLNQ